MKKAGVNMNKDVVVDEVILTVTIGDIEDVLNSLGVEATRENINSLISKHFSKLLETRMKRALKTEMENILVQWKTIIEISKEVVDNEEER